MRIIMRTAQKLSDHLDSHLNVKNQEPHAILVAEYDRMDETNSATREFTAIGKVHDELLPLEPEARKRVLEYLIDLLDVNIDGRDRGSSYEGGSSNESHGGGETDGSFPHEFDTFAELFDAANPSSNADRALVAGYWLQVHDGAEGFDSQSANSLLKDLGHGLANVTAALTSLKEQRPALVLQLRKSGSSQQARKTYKLTMAGIKAIKSMIGAEEY